MARRARGYASVWFLILIALICAFALGSQLFEAGGLGNPKLLAGAVLAVVVLVAACLFEAKRDLYAFAKTGGLVALIGLPFAAGWFGVFEDDHPGALSAPVVVPVFAVLIAACIASVVIIFRARRAKDTLTDLLREQFKNGQIYERNGVQFAYDPMKATLVAGEQLMLKVVAQNCFDQPRTIAFGLKAESRISFNSAKLEVPSPDIVEIPALATVALTIPIRAQPKAKGSYALLATPVIGGSGGKRVRIPRAKEAPGKRAWWMFFLGHLGHLLYAQQLRVRLSVTASPAPSFDSPGAPEAQAVVLKQKSEVIWKPEAQAPLGFEDPYAQRGAPRSPAPMAILGALALIGITFYAQGGSPGSALSAAKELAANSPADADQKDGKPDTSGGLAAKKDEFDASKELTIHKAPGTKKGRGPATLRLTTVGLAKHGRPEFELIDVPETFEGAATELLLAMSNSTVNDDEIKSGESWGGHLPEGWLVVARVSAIKGSKGVLRVSDLDDETGNKPARMAITCVAASDAHDLRESGDLDGAKGLLHAAIDWYPGTLGPGMNINKGTNANQNDNFAYYSLSQLGEDADKNYLAALERSEPLTVSELGGFLPPAVSPGDLGKDALAIVAAFQEAEHGIDGAPKSARLTAMEKRFHDAKLTPNELVEMLLPTASQGDDALEQAVLLVPSMMSGYFYAPPARAGLKDGHTVALAAEIYAKYQPHPALALAVMRETLNDVYGSGVDTRPAPKLTLSGNGQQAAMLSRILATLGRDLAAGLDEPELRARWKLSTDKAAAASAAKKLAALGAREDEALAKINAAIDAAAPAVAAQAPAKAE